MVRSGGCLRPDELPERQKALRQISVSECEFSKPVDQVFLIQTGTAPGDIHVADRLSQTSCLLHPDFLPQVKKISTLSDRHLPEGFLPLWEFVRSKAPSATNHLAVHAELTQFLFRLLFGQEVDAVDTLFFGRLHIHQRIIQENALICL